MKSVVARVLILLLIVASKSAVAVSCSNNAIYYKLPGATVADCHPRSGTKVIYSLDDGAFAGERNSDAVSILGTTEATQDRPQSIEISPLYSGRFYNKPIDQNFPKSIGNLVAWYDANNYLNGYQKIPVDALAKTIKDKSGNKYDLNLTSSTPGKGYINKSYENRPVNTLYCDGTNYYTTSGMPSINYERGITVFVVADSLSANAVLVQHGDPAASDLNSWSFNIKANKDNFTAYNDGGSLINITGSLPNANVFTNNSKNLKISVGHINNVENIAYLWQNWAAGIANTYNGGLFSSNTKQLSLCGNVIGNNLYQGAIAEVIIYNKFLLPDEINAITQYLNYKWTNNQTKPDCVHEIESPNANKLVPYPDGSSGMPMWPNANRNQTSTFECTPGLVTSRTCNAGGWGASTNCIPATCNNASIPLPANATFASGTTPSGNTVTLTCGDGYMGSPSVTCQGTSWRSVTGSCVSNSCNNADALPMTNGGPVKNSGTTAHNEYLGYYCDAGYTVDWARGLCKNGAWTVEGRCASTSCPNANLSYANTIFNQSGTTNNGSAVTGSCDTSNCYNASSITASCSNGAWSYSGSCTPQSCTIYSYKGGTSKANYITVGQTASACFGASAGCSNNTRTATCSCSGGTPTITSTSGSCYWNARCNNNIYGTATSHNGSVCYHSDNSSFTENLSYQFTTYGSIIKFCTQTCNKGICSSCTWTNCTY